MQSMKIGIIRALNESGGNFKGRHTAQTKQLWKSWFKNVWNIMYVYIPYRLNFVKCKATYDWLKSGLGCCTKTCILMHLQKQCDVWLDNIINLWQNILGYTVANLTSLHNVAFHWFKSEYMQLASGFMQLAAAGPIYATKYIFAFFIEGKALIVY